MREKTLRAVLGVYNNALDEIADDLEPYIEDATVHAMIGKIRGRVSYPNLESDLIVTTAMLELLAGDLDLVRQMMFGDEPA